MDGVRFIVKLLKLGLFNESVKIKGSKSKIKSCDRLTVW